LEPGIFLSLYQPARWCWCKCVRC